MARILYLLLSSTGLSGGQKMALRHVETLRDLGFDAYVLMRRGATTPSGISHRAPILFDEQVRPRDVVVIPENADGALRSLIGRPNRVVMFAQAIYGMIALGLEAYEAFPQGGRPAIMVVSPEMQRLVRRLYPGAPVEMVPCFADERVFRPAAEKQFTIASSLTKRPTEQGLVAAVLRRAHAGRRLPEWRLFQGVGEAEVAEIFGRSALAFSTNRAESVGLTTLEAMASGCVCAGFLGVGGLQYGTPENGFWVPDDDCVAAADAVAAASELVLTGGAPLANMIEAARATADAWSYRRFRKALEESWMRLAPDARRTATALSA